MKNTFGKKHSLLSQISYTASYGTSISVPLGILIEAVSCLQITFLVLNVSFTIIGDREILIFSYIRDLLSVISLSGIFTVFDSKLFRLFAWFLISVYLLIYFSLMLFVLVMHKRDKKINCQIEKLCTFINFLHGKVALLPISYYYLKFVSAHNKCGFGSDSNLIFCETSLNILTGGFLLINQVLSSLKEVLFYQTYKSKNSFAVKSNLHSLIQLIHKTLVLPLMVFLDNDLEVIIGALNVIFCLIYHLLLFVRLPFFSAKCLKITVSLSTISTTFSFILLWKLTIRALHPRTFEFLVLFLTPIITKLMLIKLNRIFTDILELKSSRPIEVVHFAGLWDEYFTLDKSLRYKNLYAQGLLKNMELEENHQDKPNKMKNPLKDKFYLCVVRQLVLSHKKHPKSTAILLLIIQYYAEKIQNISSAMAYIQKIQALSLSIPELNTLSFIKNRLQKAVHQAYLQGDKSTDCVSYFNSEEIFVTFKEKIIKEANIHSKFWEMFSSNKIDVYQFLEISKQADRVASQINQLWTTSHSEFKKSFIIPIAVYQIYLSIIKGLPHLGQDLLDKLYGKNARFVDFLQKWLDQEKAFIIISNQQEMLGKILKASSSVKNLFNIEKEDLIGRKINILMPQMIANSQDYFVQSYSQKSGYELVFDYDVYCKTIDGNFFSANLSVRVYPNIYSDFGLIGDFCKKEDHQLILFIDVDGNIIDCSRDLMQILHIDPSLNDHSKIQDLASEFDTVNAAFNMIYSPKPLSTGPLSSIRSTTHNQYETKHNKEVLFSEAFCLIGKDTAPNSTTTFRTNNCTARTDLQQEPYIQRKKDSFKIETSYKKSVSFQTKSAMFLNDLDMHKVKLVQEDGNTDNPDLLDINEAERICEDFQKGKIVSFFPSKAGSEKGFLKYFVTVKHLIFQGKIYKVVELRHMKLEYLLKKTLDTPYYAMPSPNNTRAYQENPFDSCCRNQILKRDDSNQFTCSNLNQKTGSSPPDTNQNKNKAELKEINDKLIVKSLEAINTKEKSEVESTKLNNISLQSKRARGEKSLHDLFKQEKSSFFIRAYITMFYVAAINSAIFTTFNLLMTKSSLNQLDLTARLVNADSERLSQLTSIWASINLIYNTKAQEIYPSPTARLPQVIQDQITALRDMTEDIASLLNKVDSDEIIEEFFDKDIHFWGE